MPTEFLDRENHPYKYGYGKLFHSGYHFIDLLAWLLEVNRETKNKQINKAEMYVSTNNPTDFFHVFNNYDYKKILKTNRFEKTLVDANSCKDFGEIDLDTSSPVESDDDILSQLLAAEEAPVEEEIDALAELAKAEGQTVSVGRQ